MDVRGQHITVVNIEHWPFVCVEVLLSAGICTWVVYIISGLYRVVLSANEDPIDEKNRVVLRDIIHHK